MSELHSRVFCTLQDTALNISSVACFIMVLVGIAQKTLKCSNLKKFRISFYKLHKADIISGRKIHIILLWNEALSY